MNSNAIKRIEELNEGKVVRIFKNGWSYKLVKMETMAAIVMTPTPYEDELELIEQIKMTGHCTMTQAELLIEHLYN